MDFDKQGFANLLHRAKGNRSINRYGSDAGVDPAYISRLMRGLISNSPSASIIKKLADASCNNITAQELMTAAGYLNSESYVHDKVDPGQTTQWQEWEKVIEEAARYEISPEMAFDLISSVGKSMHRIKK